MQKTRLIYSIYLSIDLYSVNPRITIIISHVFMSFQNYWHPNSSLLKRINHTVMSNKVCHTCKGSQSNSLVQTIQFCSYCEINIPFPKHYQCHLSMLVLIWILVFIFDAAGRDDHVCGKKHIPLLVRHKIVKFKIMSYKVQIFSLQPLCYLSLLWFITVVK